MRLLLKTTTLVLLFISPFYLNAQSSSDAEKKVKFGKIDISEFETKPFGKDSAASAIVLFDIGTTNFSINTSGRWCYTFERHKRIKILTKDGYNYANFEIPIYKSNSIKEELQGTNLAAYNLEGGKITQSKANKDEKFADKYNSNWTINKFTVSNIKEGTIVEIKYKIQSEDIYNLRQWYFQGDIPNLWSDFTLTIPEYFTYKVNTQSIVDLNLVSRNQVRESFSGMVSEATSAASNFAFECNSDARRWLAKNVPAFKNEPFITTADDYITKIDFELNSTMFPQDLYRTYSSTWGKIVESLINSESFGNAIKVNGFSKDLAGSLVNPQDSVLLKMQKIYNHVKHTLKWNGGNNIYTSNNSPKVTFDKKSGNSADINLSLIALLKSAGVNASPFLISTRSNGRHPGIPLITKFNYVIAAVEHEDRIYYLDATNPYYSVNCPSTEALNHQGLIIDSERKTGSWRPIEPSTVSITNLTNYFTLDKDVLTGYVSKHKTYYDALDAKRKHQSAASKEDYIKAFKGNLSGINVIDFIPDSSKNSQVFSEKFNITIDDLVEEAGNLLYFNPIIFERTSSNPFIADERSFPVDFTMPKEENYKLIFNIPDTHTLEKLPTSIQYTLEDKSASFTYLARNVGSQILIHSKIVIGSSLYSPEQYFDLKNLFKEIVSKQAEPIVLKKL